MEGDNSGDPSSEFDVTERGNSLDVPDGTPPIVVGKIGNARSFNGTNQYFSSASTTDLQIGSGETVMWAWVKPNGVTGQRPIMSKGGDSALIILDGTMVFTAGDAAANVASSATISAGGWYLIVGRYSAAGQAAYISINGGVVESNPQDDVPVPNAADFVVGSNGVAYFDGLIDESGISKSASPLTDDQFSAICSYLWNGGNGRQVF